MTDDHYYTTYYSKIAAAYCRGTLGLRLETNDSEAISRGVAAKLPGLYRFKRHDVLIPRVRELLGVVRSFGVGNILDVASQRGAFLWPLLDGLDAHGIMANVTAIDISDEVCAFLSAVSKGGGNDLGFTVARADVTDLANSSDRTGFTSFPDKSFDAVICSEILEHLTNPTEAAREMLRVTSNLVVCTVPAQPDDNEEHIQLFYDGRPHDARKVCRPIQEAQTNLRQLWLDAGATSVKVRMVHDGAISVLLAVIIK